MSGVPRTELLELPVGQGNLFTAPLLAPNLSHPSALRERGTVGDAILNNWGNVIDKLR